MLEEIADSNFVQELKLAKLAAKQLAAASTGDKNKALAAVADALVANADTIVAANIEDLERGRATGMSAGLLDRLQLDNDRVLGLAAAVREIISLTDPVGQVVRGNTMYNGILLQQVRVPFGVIGAIYEARPNVTVDIAALALKTGNAVVLRGGSAALNTNTALTVIIQNALVSVGFARESVVSIDGFGRDGANWLMQARGYVDVLIPRGSQSLINAVLENAKVPVIETGAGVVHIYADKACEIENVVDTVENAKVQRPGVCNAVDTLLVHSAVAQQVLPAVVNRLATQGVQFFGCAKAQSIVPEIAAATEETWATEHLSLCLGIKVVADLDSAIAHIDQFSTGHTEAILSNDVAAVEEFIARVDAASVIANASTRFTDGSEFGFGAEVGISTQKLHARGPMALPEMTSTKWVLRGSGQIRS